MLGPKINVLLKYTRRKVLLKCYALPSNLTKYLGKAWFVYLQFEVNCRPFYIAGFNAHDLIEISMLDAKSYSMESKI